MDYAEYKEKYLDKGTNAMTSEPEVPKVDAPAPKIEPEPFSPKTPLVAPTPSEPIAPTQTVNRQMSEFRSVFEDENLVTHDELIKNVSKTFDIDTESIQSLRALDMGALKESFTEMDRMMQDFPQIRGSISSISVMNIKQYAGMRPINGKNQLILSSKWFTTKNVPRLRKQLERDYLTGYAPTKDIGGVFRHENGHGLHNLLLKGKNPKALKSVVDEAISTSISKGNYAGKSHMDIINDLSKNAHEKAVLGNYKEAIADAMDDYYRNGAGAKPLSKEIFNILKRDIK
jgi:hypothetical protein